MQITLYTTSTCPYCKQEKEYLASQQKQFTEIILDQDQTKMSEMLSVSGGFSAVPVTVLVSDDGTKTVIKGFDKDSLEKTLSGQPITQATQKIEEIPATPVKEGHSGEVPAPNASQTQVLPSPIDDQEPSVATTPLPTPTPPQPGMDQMQSPANPTA